MFPITLAEILGWPALILSLVLLFVGMWNRNIKIAIVGAAFATPFIFYLFGTPRFYLGFIPAVALISTLISLRKNAIRLAYLFSLTYFVFWMWLGYTVLVQ